MKRDMDLCRQLMLFYESDCTLPSPECDADTQHQHMVWLIEAGLIAGEFSGSTPTGTPRQFFSLDGRCIETDGGVYERFPLTWQGCEFLDAARDDERWQKAKSIGGNAKDWTFSTLRQVLSAIATQGWQSMIQG